ncbi:MAG: response regulator [Magnetococcales bacterium]|nr:response regulator transcription factor [Magnetococcales bacterium]NGZ28075.1 response regulator [Magnetococcales bacterium]
MSNEKISLLLIEDEDAQRMIYQKVFAKEPFQVIGEASNGQEGVQLFTQLKPDIILCDIHMPIMDGLATLKNILALDDKACIIMLTIVDHPDIWQECIALGARYFMKKNTPYSKMQQIVLDSWQEHQRMVLGKSAD